MSALSEVPLEFSPGTAWNYSVSTDIVGRLVELYSGERFDEYLRRHLFEPLGMEDTGFFVPPEKLERFAACYDRGPGKKLRLQDDPETSRYLEPPRFLSGAGGLVSTAYDYLRFSRAMLNGGELEGARILGRKTVELMTTNHLPGGGDLASLSVGLFSEVRNEGTGFGLGFSVNLDPVANQGAGSVGEFCLGGRGEHGIHHRPHRGADPDLHDPAHAVTDLRFPRADQGDRARRDHKLSGSWLQRGMRS